MPDHETEQKNYPTEKEILDTLAVVLTESAQWPPRPTFLNNTPADLLASLVAAEAIEPSAAVSAQKIGWNKNAYSYALKFLVRHKLVASKNRVMPKGVVRAHGIYLTPLGFEVATRSDFVSRSVDRTTADRKAGAMIKNSKKTAESVTDATPTPNPTGRVSLLPTKKVAVVQPAVKTQPAAERTTHSESALPAWGCVVQFEGDELVIRLPLLSDEQRRISASGKSIICASTNGTKGAQHLVDGFYVPVVIDGKRMRVTASAWISAG